MTELSSNGVVAYEVVDRIAWVKFNRPDKRNAQNPTLNRDMTRFVGLGNFSRLFASGRFWGIFFQTSLFAVSAVVLKAILGFSAAHFMHNIPLRAQRKWRGMLLIPWVVPPVLSTLAWRELFDPTFGAINWTLSRLGFPVVYWLADAGPSRFVIVLATVWFGAPFFMMMTV